MRSITARFVMVRFACMALLARVQLVGSNKGNGDSGLHKKGSAVFLSFMMGLGFTMTSVVATASTLYICICCITVY